jgi:hypothetical protein
MLTEPETQAGPSSAKDAQQEAGTSHASPQIRSSPEGKHCQCSASANEMAADLKDIRSFMLSAMKSLDIPVSEGDAKKIDVANLKPNDSMYIEEKVTEFWSGRLPTGECLNRLCDQILSVFTEPISGGSTHETPEILVLDRNSKPVTLNWTYGGHLNVGDGMDMLNMIRDKWPETLGRQPGIWDEESQFKELFCWEFPRLEEVWPEQLMYDQDEYPSYLGPGVIFDREVRNTVYAIIQSLTYEQRYTFVTKQRVTSTNYRFAWEFQKFAAVWYEASALF